MKPAEICGMVVIRNFGDSNDDDNFASFIPMTPKKWHTRGAME